MSTEAGTRAATETPPNLAHASILVVAAIISLLFGILTTVGITGSHLSRMYRDNAGRADLFFALVILGVALTLIAPLRTKHERGTSILGIIVFLFGVLLAIIFGIEAVGTENRPEIDASIESTDGTPVISASVRYEGLESTQRVTLQIVGGEPTSAGDLEKRRLFSTELGPDTNGDLNRTFHVRVAPATLQRFYVITGPQAEKIADAVAKPTNGRNKPTSLCRTLDDAGVIDSDLASCVEVLVPEYTRTPDLDATWPDPTHLEITARDSDLRSADAFALRVMGRQQSTTPPMLMYDAVVARGGQGLDRTLRVDVPPSINELCVEAARGASRSDSRTDCFARPKQDERMAWLFLTRPADHELPQGS